MSYISGDIPIYEDFSGKLPNFFMGVRKKFYSSELGHWEIIVVAKNFVKNLGYT